MASTLLTAEGNDNTTLRTDTLALGEAAVSASRAPMTANVAARQVLTLTHDDLAAAGVQSLNDVLKLSAGVDVRQRGGFGIQTDISIDGGTHDQITILLNGVPLVNPQTGHNAADFPVNIADIERIEILEGAASRVMGSQAFSGAINVVTRNNHTPTHLEALLEGGSYGTVKGEARTAWQWAKHWSGSASGSYQRSDGAVQIVPSKGARGMDNYPTMLQTFASTYKRVLRPMTLEPTHSIRLPTPINGRRLVATSYRHGLRVKDAFTLYPNFRGCVVSTTSN